MKFAESKFRRAVIGVVSVVLLIAALVMFLAFGIEQGRTSIYVGICLRLGLVLGSIWLAWPQLEKLVNVLPRIILIGAGAGLLASVVYSRLLPIVLTFIVAAIGIQLVFRFVSSKTGYNGKRDQ